MLAPQLVTPPDENDPAVSLEELKAHLHVDFDDDDGLIDSLGRTAERYLDGYTGILGICLVEQTWSQSFPSFPCGESYLCENVMRNVLRLKLEPALSIVSVKYYNSAGTLTTVATDQYRLLSDVLGPFVASIPGASAFWPSSTQTRADAVVVEYKAGYGGAADVPEPIRAWIKRQVSEWYENRESSGAATVSISDIFAYKRTFFV